MPILRRIALLSLLLFPAVGTLHAVPIPSPEQVLGFAVGADHKLANWAQIEGYFRILSDASPRIRLESLGSTTLGNRFFVAVISGPDNLARLEELRQVQVDLADPRQLTDSLGSLLEKGRTVVLATCSIHATEVAAAQMSMEFAWEMASQDDPETREILREVIFLLVPSLNPDGLNIVHDWYQKTLGTPAEGLSPPQLYHSYVGHDNNRDWFMFTQIETRLTVATLHNRWHPQIVYDLHQMGTSGPRMFVPPFVDPIDRNVDPILQTGIVELGGAMFSALISSGRRGIVTNAIYDAFTPARSYQHYHGGVRILSESASVRLASPVDIPFSKLNAGRNYDTQKTSWNFPVLWPGGRWSLRDIVDEQKIALRACLRHAAVYRKRWLRNFFQVGLNALEPQKPAAFIIPPAPEQLDRRGLHDLLDVLHFGGVEISRTLDPIRNQPASGVSPPYSKMTRSNFPAGSWIVQLRQPYGSFAKTMLEIQEYPKLPEYPGGPLQAPYDTVGHTLGIQLGVSIYQLDHPPGCRTEEVRNFEQEPQFSGEGKYWLFPHSDNSFAQLCNRLLEQEHQIFWAPNGFSADGQGYPVGTLMAYIRQNETNAIAAAAGLPLEIRRVERWPQLAWQRLRPPRIGIYQGHDPSIDEGWTRWILEKYEFPYQTLKDRDIQGTGLHEFDVIVFADQPAQSIKEGLRSPYPEELRGGIGEAGSQRLLEFAQSGGTLLFLGESTDFPIREWNLDVRELTKGLEKERFYCPGSLLRAEANYQHPIAYGTAPEIGLMFVRSKAFQVGRGVSVVDFPHGELLLSGWLNGGEHLQGSSALVDIPVEAGRVVLIGFRTQFRAQTRYTYKFLFNTLFLAGAAR